MNAKEKFFAAARMFNEAIREASQPNTGSAAGCSVLDELPADLSGGPDQVNAMVDTVGEIVKLDNEQTSTATELPRVNVEGIEYFRDVRLGELRNVNNPHDRLPLTDDIHPWDDPLQQ